MLANKQRASQHILPAQKLPMFCQEGEALQVQEKYAAVLIRW